jgi:hypothetical protein
MWPATGLLVDFDSQARLSEHDFVARLETNPTSPSGDCERPAVSNNAGPVDAAVVMQPEFSGTRFVRDVSVLAGDTLVDVVGPFRKCHLVCSDEPAMTISHLGAPP